VLSTSPLSLLLDCFLLGDYISGVRADPAFGAIRALVFVFGFFLPHGVSVLRRLGSQPTPLYCISAMAVGWACGRARGRGALREGDGMGGDGG
jgi:hypothetical protein